MPLNPLPTILEGSNSQPQAGGLVYPENTGVGLIANIWSVTGLTAGTYSRSLKKVIGGGFCYGAWRFTRLGGCGCGSFEIHEGIPDLDAAVQGEWELEVQRGLTATPTTWYKARIVDYEIEATPDGKTKTKIWTEGYASKLAELTFTATIAAGQTVKQAVTTLLDTYVTPNTRIRYNTADVVGDYTLVGTLAFKNTTVLQALHLLAMLQGQTEWGVTEGGPIPAFYFFGQSTGTANDMNFILGKDVIGMRTEGEFRGAYNGVTVLGGFSGSSMVSGSSSDSTAQSTFGVRQRVVLAGPITNATDAARLAANYVTMYKDGNGRFVGNVVNPSDRIEPDRTNSGYGTGTPTIPVSPKPTFRGTDGALVSPHWNSVSYTYEQACANRLRATILAGIAPETMERMLARLVDKTDSLQDAIQTISAGGGGGAPTDAQYLVLAADATLTVERVFNPSTGLAATDGGAGGNYTVTVKLSTGVSGGQSAIGGTASGENLTLSSTSHATKGSVVVGSSAFDEANTRLGINDTSPSAKVDVGGDLALQASTPTQLSADQNNYAFTGGDNTHSWYRITAVTADRTITGIAGGVDGRILIIVNVGTLGVHKNIILANLSGSSTASNQIATGMGGSITIPPLYSIVLQYHSSVSKWAPMYMPGAVLQGTAAPTQNAPIGTFFWDSTNKHFYVCDAIGHWTQIDGGSGTAVNDANNILATQVFGF